jgi:hypothetical protein
MRRTTRWQGLRRDRVQNPYTRLHLCFSGVYTAPNMRSCIAEQV